MDAYQYGFISNKLRDRNIIIIEGGYGYAYGEVAGVISRRFNAVLRTDKRHPYIMVQQCDAVKYAELLDCCLVEVETGPTRMDMYLSRLQEIKYRK